MAGKLPNGSTFDFAKTYSPDVVVTAISNANPAVCTTTAHTFKVGDFVTLNSGWVKATGRVFRVSAVTAATGFTLEGLDTTNVARFPLGSSAGTAKSVLTWVNIPQITEVASSGGDQNFYTFGYLEDDDDRQIPTSKNPTVLTLTVADDPSQPFVPVLEAADEAKTTQVQRLNLVGGDIILYSSIASITSTPTLTRNQLMTRSITLAQQARITRYKAAAGP